MYELQIGPISQTGLIRQTEILPNVQAGLKYVACFVNANKSIAQLSSTLSPVSALFPVPRLAIHSLQFTIIAVRCPQYHV